MSVLEFFSTNPSFLISCAHSHVQLISVISEYLILLKGEILLSIAAGLLVLTALG